MSYIQDRIISHCEKYLVEVKQHSRHTAIKLVERERKRLVDIVFLFIKYDDLQSELDELEEDLLRVDELLKNLKEN